MRYSMRHQQDRKADPREKRIVGWEQLVPLYEVNLPHGLVEFGYGAKIAAGTTYPSEGKFAFAVHVDFEKMPTPFMARRIMGQIYRAMVKQAEENGAWVAAAKLGGHDDLKSLPVSRPSRHEVHCFWMMMVEYPKPVLAFRVAYDDKDTLKGIFNEVYEDYSKGEGFTTHSGWIKQAKAWWLFAEHGYPRVLGRLRLKQFRLKWIQREGYPPAPPIEEPP